MLDVTRTEPSVEKRKCVVPMYIMKFKFPNLVERRIILSQDVEFEE